MLERRLQNPLLVPRGLAVDHVEKFMDAVAEVECVICACHSLLGSVVVVLQDEVVAQFTNR